MGDWIAISLIALFFAAELSLALAAHRIGDEWTTDLHLEMAAEAVAVPGRRVCVKCGRTGGELTGNGCPEHPQQPIKWRMEDSSDQHRQAGPR